MFNQLLLLFLNYARYKRGAAYKECDFVVREGMRIMKAYQVTIVMNDEKTRKREIEGLMEAMNAYGLAEGYILTMEEKEELEIDGKQVHVLPTWEWMLREK